MLVVFWGTRGSLPVSGPHVSRYGGNTMCVEVRTSAGSVVFDIGTGALALGRALVDEGLRDPVDVFLTHTHLDHLLGLPMFAPMHEPTGHVRLHAGHLRAAMPLRSALDRLVGPPLFPLSIDEMEGHITTTDFTQGDPIEPFPGVRLFSFPLNHPGGATGYRIEADGRAVTLVWDHEIGDAAIDDRIARVARGTDLLVVDATLLPDEYEGQRGHGHSTWEQAADLARAADADGLAIVHAAVTRTDAELDALAPRLQARFPRSVIARDGMRLSVPL